MTDASDYRRVLGNFPTGVAVITANTFEHGPVGMVVGSFTAVSLDPPLVAFLPMKSSSSYQKLAISDSFCVNFLGAHQEMLCRAFASKNPDKFAGLDWKPAPSGSPILPGAIGWVDCDVDVVHEAGDHVIVVGRVGSLSVGTDVAPLVFFRGGYGRFSTSSLVAGSEPDLLVHLKLADIARAHVEKLSEALSLGVSVTVRSANEIVILASACMQSPSRLGERLPFAAPMGAIHAAWEPAAVAKAWIENTGTAEPSIVQSHLEALERVRQRGWSIGLDRSRQRQLQSAMAEALKLGHPPRAIDAVRQTAAETAATHDPAMLSDPNGWIKAAVLSVPVRKPDGHVALGISLTGFDTDLDSAEFDRIVSALVTTCDKVQREISLFLSGG